MLMQMLKVFLLIQTLLMLIEELEDLKQHILIERLIDKSAKELNISPLEFKKNKSY